MCPIGSVIAPRLVKMLGPLHIDAVDRTILRLNLMQTRKLPSFMIVSVLKSIFNAWNTARRYRQQQCPCVFGCGAQASDSMEHDM
eukprot:1969624-Pyramimonas_sp.AAC.1